MNIRGIMNFIIYISTTLILCVLLGLPPYIWTIDYTIYSKLQISHILILSQFIMVVYITSKCYWRYKTIKLHILLDFAIIMTFWLLINQIILFYVFEGQVY